MQSKCCVLGCSKRSDRDTDVCFYRLPALLNKPEELAELTKNRRNAWLNAINRKDLSSAAINYARVCSEHFVTGVPAKLNDIHHPDWKPTLNMGSKSFNKHRDKNTYVSSINDQPEKRRQSQQLSEVEKLKLEIKSRDELIQNFRNERRQREQDQIQVVNSYEQRLKEKDVDAKNRTIQLRNKEISINTDDSLESMGRGATMRVGRKIRKTIVEPKKTKPCFVRLQKVQEEKEEQKERTPTNRNLTGPLKKRPLNTPSQTVKKVEEPLTTVASTRSRRAPKPNPKYANADIITPKAKPKRGKGLHAIDEHDVSESDSIEDYYNAMDETSNGSENNDGDAGEAFEVDESSDFSETEEMYSKPRRALRSAPHATSTNRLLTNRGRPKGKFSPIPPAKPVETKKSSQSQVQAQRPTLSQQLQQARKRKLQEVEDEEPPESIIARNKRLNIALYDANVAKPLPTLKNVTSKTASTVGNAKTQSPTAANVLAQKRLVQGLNPVRSTVPREAQEEKTKLPLQRRSPAAATKPFIETAEPASTQDDFETMPTFTIVNIHDIINKKGDCLVQPNPGEVKGTTSPNTINRINRRKTGHTTILSEKLDPGKIRNPPVRTPFPPRKPISTILSNNVAPRLQTRMSLSSVERKLVPSVSEKPAPRILNSVVAKRTYPVQPILGKLENDVELDSTEETSEKTQMVKENVGANKVLPMRPAQPRKLPPEKVFVQRQGNKLIKKITCFETWYVINIPETQEPVVKNCLDIPLITLSNAAKTIRLPSPCWSTKVTLYKLSTQMLGKTSLTPFTGDLSDQSIAEEDREKYQPSCVMFRRMTQQKSRTRMPYDRAVIFKLKTFFTNIDGKNVRLIGAPSTISSFEEIEVLLELIDELDLLHEFVETANTV